MPRLATKRCREKIERDKAGVKKGDEKAGQGERGIRGERESFSKQKGMKRGKRRRVKKGSRLRAGQYAQAGHGGSYGNEMRSKERSYGRPGRPGGERLAGGAKTVGGAIPLP